MADSSHHTPLNLDERYVLTPQTRRRALTILGSGLVLLIIGAILLAVLPHETHATEGAAAEGGAHHEFHWITRLWANLWLNNVYFTGIAIIGVFFLAVQYVAYAGWSAQIQRIFEAFGYFLPVTGVIMLALFLIAGHDLFHWTHEELYDPKSPQYDAIIAGKQGYLNTPFFLIRMVFYFGAWIFLFFQLRKNSVQEDTLGGVANYNRNKVISAIFIIIFAVTSSTSAWDWVMSIDTHWYSTMFGWYVFASWFVSGLSVIALVVAQLKEKGYLPAVNASHLHDLGKFIFAFSIFWTYIWFSQFLLIYYANIPEESIYFLERLEGYNHVYSGVFFLNIFINFVFPFMVLMTRDSKRQLIFLKVVSSVLLFGHWLDFYLMIMPATVGENGGFGLVEIGSIMLYVGAFILVVSTALSRVGLIAKNHPMLQESVHHEI